MKYRVITCMLLCLFLCLAAACAETAWDTAFTGGSGRLEQVSLYPADFAGFTEYGMFHEAVLRILADLRRPGRRGALGRDPFGGGLAGISLCPEGP